MQTSPTNTHGVDKVSGLQHEAQKLPQRLARDDSVAWRHVGFDARRDDVTARLEVSLEKHAVEPESVAGHGEKGAQETLGGAQLSRVAFVRPQLLNLIDNICYFNA